MVTINDFIREININGGNIKYKTKIENENTVNFKDELKSLIKNECASIDYNCINNLKSKEVLDKTLYSAEIGVVNNFIIEVPIKGGTIKNKTKTLNVNNVNFEDVIKNKNAGVNKIENLNSGEYLTKDSNVIGDLEKKLEKIQQSMKSNNEEEVIEDVVDILNLFNINVVNNTSLPIIVDIPEPEKQLLPLVENEHRVTNISEELVQEVNKPIDIMLPMVKGSYSDNTPEDEIREVVKNELEDVNVKGESADILEFNTLNVANIDLNKLVDNASGNMEAKRYSDKLLNILYEDTITNLPQKSVENVNKLLDEILPLLKDSYGDNILKADIIEAIKKKFEAISAEDKDGDTLKDNSLNILSVKQSNILEKISYKVDGEKYLNEAERAELSNLNFKTVHTEKLSKEDKILNKALGLERTDNFLQVMNRLNIRNDIETENTISSSTVFKDTMNEDIVKNVKFMIKNQVHELQVKIYPKELGEMTIKILSEEGIMRAEIKATSKETYHLLHSNINEIKNSLSNENIKIQEVNIGLYNDDTTYYSGQEYQQGSYNGNERYTNNGRDSVIKECEEKIEEVINTDTSNVDLLV